MKRIILIDPNEETREVLVTRLLSQGYLVDAVGSAAEGAELALSAPPSAIIADLWMPSISGVQLCRLLRAESATLEVPIILRGEEEDPKSRFWAERAGAVGYVKKGRMGELVRLLAKASIKQEMGSDFFIEASGDGVDIRDRIARHLDAALFESVIAAEVRALAASGTIDRLFDLLSQLVAQLVRYRWLAIGASSPKCFAIHCHPRMREESEREARKCVTAQPGAYVIRVEDEDAEVSGDGPEPLVFDIPFGGQVVGTIAIAPLPSTHDEADNMLRLISRELGGPIRMAALVDEQKRLAEVDPLTSIFNRRSFLRRLGAELGPTGSGRNCTSLLLLDVDHFKAINDTYGHPGGDEVLVELAATLSGELPEGAILARWGGEEFVVALPGVSIEPAERLALTILEAIRRREIHFEGRILRITSSIGVAVRQRDESIARLVDAADRAMYSAKVGGRNRVVVADVPAVAAED